MSAQTIKRCLQAVRSARAASAGGAPKRLWGQVVAACTDLYRDPACRLAFGEVMVEARPEAIRACCEAYCSRLPPPRPGACSASPGSSKTSRLTAVELLARVLRRDLGPGLAAAVGRELSETAELLLAEAGRSRMETIEMPEQAGSPPRVSVHVSPGGHQVRLDGRLQVFISSCPGGPDRAGLAVALCRMKKQPGLAAQGEITVSVDDAVSYSWLSATLDVATSSGFVWPDVTDGAPSLAGRPGRAPLPPARRGMLRLGPRCGQVPPPCDAPIKKPVPTRTTLPPEMSPREITAQVTVTRDGICLEGRRVVETRSLSLAGVDWNIPPLREALRRVVREGGEDQVTRTVVIRAEGGIEFRLIKHVMYTAALAGFSSISFETGADRRGALVCRPQSNGR